jgi:transcriptional regulator with XRE-family HTH domain
MATAFDLTRRIGAALRGARIGKGLTLHALSEKSGLSEAFLSRLERGQASTSIANLIALSGVLDVSLAELFEPGSDQAAPRSYVVVRAGERRAPRQVAATGYRYEPLVSGWAGQRMDAFILTFPPRNRAHVMTAHEGEELIYVLQGKIVFHLGDERVALGAGDCIYFKADIPHMGKNVGDMDARVLMVTAPGRGPGREFGWWKTPEVAPSGRRRRRQQWQPGGEGTDTGVPRRPPLTRLEAGGQRHADRRPEHDCGGV